LISPGIEEGARANEERSSSHLQNGRKGCVNVAFAAGLKHKDLSPENASRRLHFGYRGLSWGEIWVN
jgi:hypothetical protein